MQIAQSGSPSKSRFDHFGGPCGAAGTFFLFLNYILDLDLTPNS
jgi:hypothetical protein